MKNNIGARMENLGVFLIALLMISPAGFALSSAQATGIGYLNMKIYSGWNMVSIPFDTKVSMSDVAEQCGTTPYAWRLSQSGYAKEYTLVPNTGYWIKGTRECDFTVSGSGNIPSSADLFSGWNLVGAPRLSAAVSDYAGTCDIVGGPWYYDHASTADRANPYTYSATLESGNAYWVKVSSACKLGSDQPPPPPSGNQAPVITSVSGPTSLNAGEQGTWSVSAYDPEGKQLTYYATWGDEPAYSNGNPTGTASVEVSQTSTFTHIYYNAGSYNPTFKVVDDQGASASSTSSVSVGAILPSNGVDISGRKIKGSSSAQLTIVEFSDFECPFCAMAQSTLSQVAQNYPNSVNFVHMNFPLSFHPNAQKAAEAVECAGDQGAYWSMHDKLFANQNAITVPDIKNYASQLGLDRSTFDYCLDNSKEAAAVSQQIAAGTAIGISGTPTFLIGTRSGNIVSGTKLEGAQAYSEFQRVISTYIGNPTNQPPVISTVSVPASLHVNEQGAWAINAYDPENGPLTYTVTWGDEPASATAAPAKAEWTSQTATLTHTYSQAGTYTATFTVTDDHGLTAQTASTTQVVAAQPSYVKVSMPAEGSQLKAGSTYTITWSVSDDLKNYLRCIDAIYVQSGGAYRVVCDLQPLSTGQYSWTVPANMPPGNYKMRVGVQPSGSGAYGESSVFSIVNPTNHAPVISSVGGPTNLATGATGTWTLLAHDPEGGPLTYYINWGDEATTPAAASASTVTQSSSMTHVYYAPGSYNPTFTVVDDQGASATASVSVNVAGSIIVCQPQPVQICPSGFVSYQYTDSSGCQRYGCKRIFVGAQQQNSTQ